jgi:hypothetical protein
MLTRGSETDCKNVMLMSGFRSFPLATATQISEFGALPDPVAVFA